MGNKVSVVVVAINSVMKTWGHRCYFSHKIIGGVKNHFMMSLRARLETIQFILMVDFISKDWYMYSNGTIIM